MSARDDYPRLFSLASPDHWNQLERECAHALDEIDHLRALVAAGRDTPTPDPFPNRAVADATYQRHLGEWRACDDPRPHSEHQLCYSPWLGCPGVRVVPVQEPTPGLMVSSNQSPEPTCTTCGGRKEVHDPEGMSPFGGSIGYKRPCPVCAVPNPESPEA